MASEIFCLKDSSYISFNKRKSSSVSNVKRKSKTFSILGSIVFNSMLNMSELE